LENDDDDDDDDDDDNFDFDDTIFLVSLIWWRDLRMAWTLSLSLSFSPSLS
jgi:hypothetical protein